MKRRITFRLSVIIALSVLFLMPLAAGEATAKTFRLTIGSGHPADAAIWAGQIRDYFAPEVKKRVEATTTHKIKWVDAYGGSVAKLGEILESVQDGILNVGLIVVPFEPVKLFLQNWCYYVPFGSPDVQQVARVSQKMYDRFPYLKNVFEKKYNQKFLGTGTISSYNLVTIFPWKKVEELKGKKIAAAGPNLPWVKSVGAVPVQSNLNEAYTSLQTGVYEGWVMNVDATVGFKLFEVAPNYAFTDFGAISVSCLTINLDTWNTLPKEIRNIMLQVGKEYNEVEAKAAQEKQERCIKTMKTAGVNLFDVPFEEKVRWANMMPNIPDEKAKEADKKGMPGSKLIKAYIEEVEKEGFKFPRRWVIN
jgi:C4-dicarboxylate-binding protein DctP